MSLVGRFGILAAACIESLSLSIFARGIGLFREILIAATFGVTTDINSFYALLPIWNLVISAIGRSYGFTLATSHERVRQKHGDFAAKVELKKHLREATLLLSVVSLIALFFVVLTAEFLWPGLPQSAKAQIYNLALLTLPWPALSGLVAILGTLQATQGRHRLHMVTSAITPMIIIACLSATTIHTVYILAALYSIGATVELAILLLTTFRSPANSIKLEGDSCAASDGSVAWKSLPLVAGALVMGVMPLVEQAAANSVSSNALVLLAYATRWPLAAVSLLVPLYDRLYLADLTWLSTDQKWSRFRRLWYRYSATTLGVGLLGFAFFGLVGSFLFRSTFGLAEMSENDFESMVSTQLASSTQLATYCFYMANERAAMAIPLRKNIAAARICGIATCAITAPVLASWMGLTGVAISSSLSLLAAGVVLAIQIAFCLPATSMQSESIRRSNPSLAA